VNCGGCVTIEELRVRVRFGEVREAMKWMAAVLYAIKEV